jgi:hypothetical protein
MWNPQCKMQINLSPMERETMKKPEDEDLQNFILSAQSQLVNSFQP